MRAQRGLLAGAVATGVVVVVIHGAVWATVWGPAQEPALLFARLAAASALVLLGAFLLPALVRPFDVRARPALAWVVAAAALVPTLVASVLWSMGRLTLAVQLLQGFRVPMWLDKPWFWDIRLVLESVDCHRQGFDVYAAGNGCLAEPAIYGPGQLWLAIVPGEVFSAQRADLFGWLGLAVSAAAAWWLARQSSGRGQLALLAAVLGGAWVLLVQRGNVDAVVIWVVIASVIVTRRWDSLWAWFLAAGLIWLMGTWKYYPFVVGLALLPALRLRHGWTVLAVYAAACAAFLASAWTTVQAGTTASQAMVQVDDIVTLGRVMVAARMEGVPLSPPEWGPGDLAVLALAVAAITWGVAFGRSAKRVRVPAAMLGVAGGALVLATVVVTGFGFAYKAAFLLLCVPLVGAASTRRPLAWYSSTVVLVLCAVSVLVVSNALLATVASVVVAGFATGAGTTALVRSLRSDSVGGRGPRSRAAALTG